jgi:WD40 repeat protein
LAEVPWRIRLVTDSLPEVLRVWNPDTGKLADEWKDLTSGAKQFAMNPAGDLLAIACSDPMGAGLPGSVRLVDVKTGKVRRELRGHRAMVTSVTFSGNGRNLVSGSQDMSAAVWDVGSGRARAVFRGHTNVINTVAFSPDNKTVATGSFDRTVKLWDVARRKDRATLAGHVGPVTAMAFSPDGKFLVSGCTGGFPDIAPNLIVWDTATGQKRADINLSGSRVTAIVFSKDGILVTATGLATGGDVRSWDVKAD